MSLTAAFLVACAVSPALAPQLGYRSVWAVGNGTDRPDALKGVAADGSGGVVVCGFVSGPFVDPTTGVRDGYLARLNAAGEDIWALQRTNAFSTEFNSVAVDDFGHVFAVGFVRAVGGGPSQALVTCYDLQGQMLWDQQIGSPNRSDLATSVLPDGSGGCLVAGSTEGNFGGPNAGGDDLFVAHLDAAGVLGNVAQFGSAEDEADARIATDGAGGYFLSANTEGALGGTSAGGSDTFLGRYDGQDNELWTIQLGTPAFDGWQGLSSDGAGGAFVCGATAGSLGGPNAGGFDAVIGRYDGAGNQLFLDQPGNSDDGGALMLSWDGASDRLYVTARRSNSPSVPDEALVAVYDAAGALLGQVNFGVAGFERPTDIAPSGLGGLVVVGFKFSAFGGPSQGDLDFFAASFEEVVGTTFCSPAVPNSTGQPAHLCVLGSTAATNNNLHLLVDQLPPSAACLFLASLTPGLTPMAGSSQGTLCLSGAIGRYVGPGQVQNSGTNGMVSLQLNLAQIPTPSGFVPALPGQTWHFQSWNRDANPTATSNFSDAVSVTFQ